MKPRSGMFRLISVILILVSFFFMLSYLVRLEQQNKIQKEIEAQKALELLKLHKEQEDEKLRLEAIELENQRLAWIDTNRAISEPGIVFVYFFVPIFVFVIFACLLFIFILKIINDRQRGYKR